MGKHACDYGTTFFIVFEVEMERLATNWTYVGGPYVVCWYANHTVIHT